MAAVFGALAVVAVVALVLELLVLRPRYEAVQADQQARADVTRVAQRFTAEVNNYDVGTIDSYQSRIGPMLSTTFRGEFQKSMQDIVAAVKQSKMTSHGDVLTSAVSSVDPDSATVLVVADADVRTVFDTRKRHFRWEVDLVKVDGRWLVDDFKPVA
jgi:Mce-associated membrane protein